MPDPNELQQFHELTEEIKAMGQESPEYRTFAAAKNARMVSKYGSMGENVSEA